jgi:prevent-host-death family protein
MVENAGMPTQINIYEAKKDLSRLLKRALLGEEIIIAKQGEPMAKLVPIKKKRSKRVLGLFKGKIHLSDDIDQPLPDDVIEDFYR